MLALRDLQKRFFRSIAAAPGSSAAERFDPLLLTALDAGGSLRPSARLDVYAQMYWARLHDVLAEDFPRVATVLGAERFREVACRYLAACPSTRPSVRWLGDGFSDFLGGQTVTEAVPFLADLARLEWARLAVFDAAPADPLQADDLRAIAATDWPAHTLRLVPACTVLASAWPVHEIWAAVGEDRLGRVDARDTVVRVWRDGGLIYQASVDPPERAALNCVAGGASFAEVCTVLERFVPPEAAARLMAGLVLRWVEDGILVRE